MTMSESGKDVENLLEKFWQAETTLEEEKLLRHLSEKDELPLEMQAYHHLQREYIQCTVPDTLERKLLNIPTKRPGMGVYQLLHKYRNVAAAVLVLMGTAWGVLYYQNYRQQQWLYTDTYNTPEEALIAVKTAMVEVAHNLDEGNEIFTTEMARIQEVQDINN
jgi:hypothetical protein